MQVKFTPHNKGYKQSRRGGTAHSHNRCARHFVTKIPTLTSYNKKVTL